MAVNETEPRGADRTLLIYRTQADKWPFMFDAILESEATRGVDVSRFPTETGAQGVDHARVRPSGYRFRGVLVNEPPDAESARRRSSATTAPDPSAPLTVAERLLGRDFNDPLISSRALGPKVDEQRAGRLFDELVGLMRARKPLKIVADGVPFTDYLLTDLTSRPLGANAVEVSGSFIQVRFATRAGVELKPVPAPTPPKKPTTTDTVDVGPKGKTEATAVETAKVKSAIAALSDAARSL